MSARDDDDRTLDRDASSACPKAFRTLRKHGGLTDHIAHGGVANAMEMISDYKVYDPSASRGAYKRGEIFKFPLVRNWLDGGKPVAAFGKIINIQTFGDDTPHLKDVPYLEVSFEDTKELGKVDLGEETRKFVLETEMT